VTCGSARFAEAIDIQQPAVYGNCASSANSVSVVRERRGRLIDRYCRPGNCGEQYTVEATGRAIDRSDLLFHCLVPAGHWWDDIVFT
jgi:hypothetical protein